MSRIHVCLVSEQTIPNILGIYHFKPERVVFCTTERMEQEKRTDAIINTLKLYGLDYSGSNLHDRIKVDQDCLKDCELKFKNEIVQKYGKDKLTVNLTGGTKIMVLGAYNVFKDAAEQMIYTPIPKNEFLVVYPQGGDCKSPVSLNLRLSVEAYVTAYGIKVKNSNKIEQLKSNALKNKDLCEWMAQNYKDIEGLLIKFYEHLKGYRDDKCFQLMTGDWLSGLCFNEICKLSVDDCVTEIKLISSKGMDNEFDVMFTKDNALYIVECKSLKQEHDKDADILYKISSLQHDFGLRVKGFLVSTARTIISDKGGIEENVIKRAEQCKSQVIHPDEIKNFSIWIKNYVNGLT